MKSLYLKLSLWSVVTLVLSVAVFLFTARTLNRNFMRGGGPLGRTMQLQVDRAQAAYNAGGRQALEKYRQDLQQFFSEEHVFVDTFGRDLLTGEDRTNLLGDVESTRFFPARRVWIERQSTSGRMRMLMRLEPPIDSSTSLLYLSSVLAALALLSYGLFRYLVRPLRALSKAVSAFGKGALGTRAEVIRDDEFGEVALRFNEMANRIETLLGAERRLLEDVSHELRSPLARMQFALELARTEPDREVAIARLRREMERLTELVGYLLEVTRAEGDPAARPRTREDLVEIVREVVEVCRIEAAAHQCQLVLQESRAWELVADRELLRRAVENVVRNAIRYAPEGSTVDVRVSEGMVVVRDHGCGVPEAELQRIFQPFYRVDASRTKATGGVGLGLAIVQRAVQLHGGRVEARNAEPGLEVRIVLPRR